MVEHLFRGSYQVSVQAAGTAWSVNLPERQAIESNGKHELRRAGDVHFASWCWVTHGAFGVPYEETMRHELAHLSANWEGIVSPFWFNEDLAQSFEYRKYKDRQLVPQ
ncbi:MAG: hypothetical protein ACI835_001094 [Planctomycetota bacterium]